MALPAETDCGAMADSLPNRWRDRLPGYGLIAVLWLLIYLRGYPAPFIDDLFFTGAAFNLALHGVFSNPYCPSLAALDSKGMFLAYMPLHSYVLAGWLKLFGLGFVSLSLFSTLTSALVCALAYRLMPVRNGFVQLLAAGAVVVLVFLLLGGAGLRPDSLGMVFFFLGIDAVRSRGAGIFFLKNFSLALAVITFPNLALLAFLVSAATLVYKIGLERTSFALSLRLVGGTALAYGLALLILLWCIDFRLGDFLHSLHLNQHYGALGVEERNGHAFGVYFIAKWLLIQAAFVGLILTLLGREMRGQKDAAFLLFLLTALAGFGALFWASLNSASGAHVWAFGCLLFSLYLLVSFFWRAARAIIWALFLGVFVFGHGHTAVEDLFSRHRVDPAVNQAIAAQLKSSSQPIYADCYAVREIFDYRLPAQVYGYETSSTTGWGAPVSFPTLPQGLFVVSVKNILLGATTVPPNRKWESLRLLGHTITPLCENPYDLELIAKVS
jgi:hypothetical protein